MHNILYNILESQKCKTKMILILLISKGKFSINKPSSKARWNASVMDGSEIQERISYSGSFNSAIFNLPMMYLLQF